MNKVIFLIIFFFLCCQLQELAKNHGILFLENRSNKLVVNKSNKNDVEAIIGKPHSKSISNIDLWFYIERTLVKGKYHKLGKHVLKSNNVLVLEFDKYGILTDKEFYNKDDIEEIAFSKDETQNELSKKSFVATFLSSMKEKMYGDKAK